VWPADGFLEVTEELVIDNPSRTTFVGQRTGDRGPVTLRLSLPRGIDKVTFDREFHGRNFVLLQEQLSTELPWPPGSRELKFIYRVPVERRYSVLTRVLDLPTEQITVDVATQDVDEVACNMPKASFQSGQHTVFEQRGSPLSAGFEVQLQLGDVPLRLETYARWLALAILIALVAGSIALARARRPEARSRPENDSRSTRGLAAGERRVRKRRRVTFAKPTR
jgi:hypothetical protein